MTKALGKPSERAKGDPSKKEPRRSDPAASDLSSEAESKTTSRASDSDREVRAMPKTKTSPTNERYFELVREFPLRPITNDDGLIRANAVIHKLIDKEVLSDEEEDYLDVLGRLVEAYEDEHHPLPAISDVAMLRYLIEARDVTQTEVSVGTGIAESTLSSILVGRRILTRSHIEALARFFKVSPAVFMSVDD
jgi:HTH-type transcriptional regulator / antitoxin HigA